MEAFRAETRCIIIYCDRNVAWRLNSVGKYAPNEYMLQEKKLLSQDYTARDLHVWNDVMRAI
jgi:hypothetical protein